MNNVLVRALSGAVYIAVIVGCILLGNLWFFGLTGLFLIVGFSEYHNLQGHIVGRRIPPVAVLLDLFVALSLWASSGWLAMGFVTAAIYAAAVFVALTVVRLCISVVIDSPVAITSVATSMLGVVYIALPLSLLNVVYQAMPGTEGATLVLVTLICIWINDTGAFCVGCTMGRRKLCQRLSPKKSWEGFWGGMAFVVAAMIVYAIVEGHNVALYAIYGALVSVLSTIGDLFESMLKRKAGVKDSGNLIPGHGGLLDRIDSLLFVSYLVALMPVILNIP